jgi:hypothetical protein
MKNKDYNEYDNPSSQMRVNVKLLKHIMIITDWCMKNETPVLIKASASEVLNRTNKYCSGHYNKVFDEVNDLENTNIERFMK